jgi:Skp family chaperone for outer membrane proteins
LKFRFCKNVSVEIEELKKEHASQIAAMQTEHETFIVELIEKHKKEEENLQKDTESQMIVNSRVMENFLLASSSALNPQRSSIVP